MKSLLFTSLLLSSTAFSQSLDVAAYKSVLMQKKVTLEKIYAGMSKKLITSSKVETESGDCSFTQSAVQSVLKVEGSKIIVHSKENFIPAASSACKEAGYEAYEENILFYEDAPSLAADIKDLEASAKDITSIEKQNDTVTMVVKIENNETLTLKYDLTKSSFKNLISTSGKDFSIISEEQSDVNINQIDLSKILFCENNEGEISNCVEGDFSDILF